MRMISWIRSALSVSLLCVATNAHAVDDSRAMSKSCVPQQAYKELNECPGGPSKIIKRKEDRRLPSAQSLRRERRRPGKTTLHL